MLMTAMILIKLLFTHSVLKFRRVERMRDEVRRHSGHGKWRRVDKLRCDGIASLACGFRVAHRNLQKCWTRGR